MIVGLSDTTILPITNIYHDAAIHDYWEQA